MRRVGLIPLSFFLVLARPAVAQWQATGEVGASRLSQASLPAATALTIGGSAATATDRFLAHTSVLGARTSDNRWTGQALIVGAAATPVWRAWQVQGSAAVSLFSQTNLRPTTSADGLIQLRGGSMLRGLAFGGGAGTTSHNAVSIPVSRGVADAWWTLGDERLSVEASLTRTRAVFGESSIFVDLSARNPNHLDLSGSWRHERGGWSAGLSAGMRDQTGSGTSPSTWTSIDAAAWLTTRMALAVSAGRTLEDLVRGVPRVSYAGVALRISSEPHVRAFAPALRGARVTVSRTGGTARVEITGVVASRVELRGDFTDWNEVALERSGNSWHLERAIAPGSHRLTIRLDGGEWIVPVNLPHVEDDLAGTVGLITVP
jgi:hypothetical protein